MSRLHRSFFQRSAAEVAPALLGTVLTRETPEGLLRGRIVETEAYTGQTDPGSHAYRGPTARNRVMFGPAGYLYVYLSYGIHHCMNVVTDVEGVAGAVLLRALEPLEGIAIMQCRRRNRPLVELCNGPGKLCSAFNITRAENGTDLESSSIWIEGPRSDSIVIRTSTRVGLSAGADLSLRFYVGENRFVSPGRPSDPGSIRRRSKQ